MEKIEYPSWKLDGKTALVTGSSKGIGKWIALGLAEKGADVIVVARHMNEVQEVAKQIKEMGRKALPIEADVTDLPSVKDMIKKSIETFGKIDILVNNAGTNVRKIFLDTTEEDYELVTNVNFKAVFFTSQYVAKEMVKRGEGGKIINVGSAGGLLLRPGIPNSIYSGTKGGVLMFTKSFAEELAKYKINVNNIAPGYFATPLAVDRLGNPEIKKTIMDFTPLKTVGGPKDAIGVAVFLASDASDFITGQTVYVDGGRTVL